MYITHNTEAIILHKEIINEDAVLDIITKDYGLIKAIAKGILKPNAKLKHLIEIGSYGKFSFIKGKNIWILKGVYNHEIVVTNYDRWKYLSQIALINPHELEDRIFFDKFLFFLKSNTSIIKSIAALLSILGYIDNKIIDNIDDIKLKSIINKFISQSHIQNDIILP